ncbi:MULTISPECIES: hypothetical protein [Thiorhodovibrio]|uniref:hypothetical protein n=1 Tax=Thiorhodovibrio TaxID=61593 RepID=UPI001912452E|nr:MULTISPECIES: hypothetical protein [Thiorhodovibrio]MBK5970397.1 hypothetical protein [Thiorhodovibrio winogradskyi]WPL14299.1 hypothetical protein Thiosp_04135 [Thiorhodovibrio litoralis]
MLLLACVLGASLQDALATGASERRRVEIGLKIFRATLAADQNLQRKLDQQERLAIVLFFAHDRASAERYRQQLEQPGGLLAYRLRVVLSDDPALQERSETPPAAVFITESRLPLADLRSLQAFSARHSRLLFSPFEADVERGVAAGVFIGARVQPYVSLSALRESGVKLQGFFLGIAKTID